MQTGVPISSKLQTYWRRLTGYLRQEARIDGLVLPIGILCMLAAMVIVSRGIKEDNLWLDPMNIIVRALRVDLLNPQTYGGRPTYGHPPLFYLLLNAWIHITGPSLVTLHLLPVLSTVLAAAFVYRIARDFTRDTFAGIAGVLVLANLGVVKDYALEVHNYASFLMLAAAVLFFFERWWARPRSWVYSAGVVLATIVIMYTHYYSLYLILALNAYALLLALRNKQHALRWFILQGVVAVLYIPQVADILNGIDSGIGSGGTRKSDIETLRATFWENAWDMIKGLLDTHVLVFFIIVLCGCLLLWFRRRIPGDQRSARFARNGMIILFYVVVSAGIALAVNEIIPSLAVRRMIYLSAGVAIVVGCALSFWPRFVRWAALAALLLILQLPHSGIPRWKWSQWNYHEAMLKISQNYQPGDLVYVQFDNRVLISSFVFYTRLTLPSDVTLLVPRMANSHSAPPRSYAIGRYTRENEHNEEYFANEVFGNYVWNRNRFWVIHSTSELYGDPGTDWVGKIDGRDFVETQTFDEQWMEVSLFTSAPAGKPSAPDPAPLPDKPDLPVSFGDAITLVDFQLDQVSAAPGEPIDVRLDWLASSLPAQNYAVYIHLLREDGTLASQVDADPTHAGHTLPTLFWALGQLVYDHKVLTVDPAVLPGQYVLKVGLYDRGAQQRLPVHLHNGQISDGLELARIEIR